MDMDKFMEVKSNLVLTYHGIDNLKSRRPEISLDDVVRSVAWGIKGFAGHRRYKSTYNDIVAIWKKDSDSGKYVVITYYKLQKRKKEKVRKFS